MIGNGWGEIHYQGHITPSKPPPPQTIFSRNLKEFRLRRKQGLRASWGAVGRGGWAGGGRRVVDRGGARVVGRELQIANWGLRIANCGSPASSLKQFNGAEYEENVFTATARVPEAGRDGGVSR